jgi:hypothetical protein
MIYQISYIMPLGSVGSITISSIVSGNEALGEALIANSLYCSDLIQGFGPAKG